MERRYQLMAALGVRNIAGFNRRVKDAIDAGKPILDPVMMQRAANDPSIDQRQIPNLTPLPYVVVVIDELADLMMIVGKKVEELIARLAQKARASGIHLVLATQRPSVDVITGLIKANIPCRIAFQVSAQGRLAHHPRPDGSRDAARPRRHAVSAAGDLAADACARRLRVRPGSAPRGRGAQDAASAELHRGGAVGAARSRSRDCRGRRTRPARAAAVRRTPSRIRSTTRRCASSPRSASPRSHTCSGG